MQSTYGHRRLHSVPVYPPLHDIHPNPEYLSSFPEFIPTQDPKSLLRTWTDTHCAKCLMLTAQICLKPCHHVVCEGCLYKCVVPWVSDRLTLKCPECQTSVRTLVPLSSDKEGEGDTVNENKCGPNCWCYLKALNDWIQLFTGKAITMVLGRKCAHAKEERMNDINVRLKDFSEEKRGPETFRRLCRRKAKSISWSPQETR